MTRINITVNHSTVDRELIATANRLNSLQPAMKSIGEYMSRRVRNHFDTETSPDGVAWKKLADATIKEKQRSKDGKSKSRTAKCNAAPNAILQRTFTLRDTINYQLRPNAVAIGTPQTYGMHHQYGAPKANIPARPFLGYNKADLAEIKEIFIDAITLL